MLENSPGIRAVRQSFYWPVSHGRGWTYLISDVATLALCPWASSEPDYRRPCLQHAQIVSALIAGSGIHILSLCVKRHIPVEPVSVLVTTAISEGLLQQITDVSLRIKVSDVAKFIDKRGEGLYAVGFKTPDAGKARAKAEEMGIRVVGDITDADLIDGKGHGRGMREIWLHPKDVFGVYALLTQSGAL